MAGVDVDEIDMALLEGYVRPVRPVLAQQDSSRQRFAWA
jgi:hypothetical protein